MNDLVAFLQFLRARLDADQAAAGKAAESWEWNIGLFTAYDATEHAERFNPARVLREVETKRRSIDLHSAEPGQHPDFCGHDKHELPCPTLRLLALPYADHPDYDPAWRI